jgi:deoxyribose-phosphate aldolase
MALVLDREQLIRKVSREVAALGLESVERTVSIEAKTSTIVKRPQDVAPFIEHTLLRPEVTREDILKLCDEAKRFGFRGVCVNPVFVDECHRQLLGTGCLVVSVVGFPFGSSLTGTKVDETKRVIDAGANEVDMVVALSALKGGDLKTVYQDIRAVVSTATSIPVKVILETVFLDDGEKIAVCLLAMNAGAAFVKTSTGFGFMRTPSGYVAGGATIEDVTLLRTVVGERTGVKAAGGIRTFQVARAMMGAGATRLGCSASVAIITEPLGE